MKVFKIVDYPALLLKGRKKVLVVADLHIGIGFIDDSIIFELKRLYYKIDADEIIVAGDIKHSIYPRFSEIKIVNKIIEELNPIIIRGNHDGGIDCKIKEFITNKIGIFHGHLNPTDDLLSCKTIIVAHSHPAILIKHGAGGIKKRVWLEGYIKHKKLEKTQITKKSKIIVMPAFNELCASTSVNVEKVPGTIFRYINPRDMEATMLDGTYLGKVCEI